MEDDIWFWTNHEMEANSIVHAAASLILHHQSWSPVVATWFTLITFWFRLKAIRTRATHSIVFISTSIIVIINTMIPALVYKLCWNITTTIVQSKAYMRVTMWIGSASTYCPSRIQSLEGIQKHKMPVWIEFGRCWNTSILLRTQVGILLMFIVFHLKEADQRKFRLASMGEDICHRSEIFGTESPNCLVLELCPNIWSFQCHSDLSKRPSVWLIIRSPRSSFCCLAPLMSHTKFVFF